MTINLSSFLIIVLITVTPLFSNNFDNKTITAIMFLGNDNTNEEVIKRELLFQVGDPFNDSLRVLSEKRIINLFLFNHVEILPLPNNNDVTLIVSVTERLHWYPFPSLKIEDRDWDKLTYGFGLAHTNLRGRNEKLVGTVLFGYRPGYQLDYSNPWINGTDHLFVSLTHSIYETRHKVLNFTQNHVFVSGSIGKYWTRYFHNKITMSYNNVTVPEEISPSMLTLSSTEELIGLSLSTVFDNRDLIAYPTQGWFVSATLKKNGLFEKKIDYYQYLLELRNFQTISEITFAARVFTTLSSGGTLPIYDRVYFGFSERVRGHFSKVISGEQLIITNFEIRFPLVKPIMLDLPNPYLQESSTKNLKFGLNGALFYEAGKVWGADIWEEQYNERTKDHGRLISGFGISLHIILPYVELARLEIAFNEKIKSEFIVEIGTSF